MLNFDTLKNQKEILSNNILKGFNQNIPTISEEVLNEQIKKGEIEVFTTESLNSFHKSLIEKAKSEKLSAGDKKVEKVMKEFKEGTLKTPAGKTVTDRQQAVAIALSEKKAVEKSIDSDVEEKMNDVKNLKRVEVKKADGSKKAVFVKSKQKESKYVKMEKEELINEHKRLVKVLESDSKEDDKKEAKLQLKELKGYMKDGKEA